MTRALDVQWMKRALANAEKGWGQTAPNPMVGAVVVSGDEVVADGWHARYGDAHAEVHALRHAGEGARGATLYVTLEPCTHHGKTPPCVDAIVAAGIARVVIAARDPNPAAGGGAEKLRSAGIAVEVGMECTAAVELNAAFFNAFRSSRPWVILKMAMSADGGVADPAGKRRWITGEESRREVHRMRANVDAVAVGIGTIIADDPALTVRDVPVPRVQPTRVVFDSSLRISSDATVVRSAFAVPTIVVCTRAGDDQRRALVGRGVRVIEASGIEDALQQLKREGILSILLEGGPTLAGAFLTDGLVDRLALFEAPIALGPDAPQAFAHVPASLVERLAALPAMSRQAFGVDTLSIVELTKLESACGEWR